MNKIKLFCFSWAGGTSIYFFKWRKLLEEWIELIPVELSGRGYRYAAPLYNSLEEAVEDAYLLVKDHLDGSQYAFFGHSMGSLIAFELSHKIKNMGKIEPEYLFVSGRWAPHIVKHNPIDINMPDEELKIAMIRLGGTSEELFENEHFTNDFIRVLRADIKIIEEYKYEEKTKKVHSCIAALTGIKDTSISNNDLFEWGKHTDNEFCICKFKGGHFFINESMKSVVKFINSKLASIRHE